MPYYHIEAWIKWLTYGRRHFTLLWRHNEHDGVSNHQPNDCLLNRSFRRRSRKTSKLRVTGRRPVNSPHKWPVTRKMFPFNDVIMKCLIVTFCILIQISQKFVPDGPIDEKSAVVHIMAWCQRRAHPVPEPMITPFNDVMRHQAQRVILF